MKHIRGFGYIDYFEPETELEHGFGSEHVTPGTAHVEAYNCPRCKLKLFEADVSLHGVIFVKCRRCKREVAIETKPLMRSIGFR